MFCAAELLWQDFRNNPPELRKALFLTKTKRRSGPGRPRSQESENAILDATLELLTEKGYSVLTVSKVAARAQASKSTIYRRWSSKEHLVIAAFDRMPALKVTTGGTLVEQLTDQLCQFISIMHHSPLAGVLPTLVGERAHNHQLAEALDPLIERRRAPTKTLLMQAIENGELPKDTDLEMAVDAIMGPILLRLFFFRGDVSRKVVTKLVRLVLHGLGASV